jgi:hypothetical protein
MWSPHDRFIFQLPTVHLNSAGHRNGGAG